MVYRKGEFKLSTLDRFYPFHVAVQMPTADDPVRKRFKFVGEIDAFYRTLSDAPRQQVIGRGETEHIIYCFASEEAAQAFQGRYGGFRIEPSAKARRAAEERLLMEQSTAKAR